MKTYRVKDDDQPQKHYTKVCNELWTDKRLDAYDVRILGYLLSVPHKWDTDRKKISKELGIGERKVTRSLQKLVDLGYRIVDRKSSDQWRQKVSSLCPWGTETEKSVSVSQGYKDQNEVTVSLVHVHEGSTINKTESNKTDTSVTDKRRKKKDGSVYPRDTERTKKKKKIVVKKRAGTLSEDSEIPINPKTGFPTDEYMMELERG